MPEPVADPDLNDTDDEILVALSDGRNVPTNLADAVGKSRQYVHQRLKLLETADYVRNIGNGVYELQPGEVPDDELERLEITMDDATDVVRERDQAQARADRLEADLEDCREHHQQAQAGGDATTDDHLIQAVTDAHSAARRAQKRLPDDAPGATPLADAVRTLAEVLEDA